MKKLLFSLALICPFLLSCSNTDVPHTGVNKIKSAFREKAKDSGISPNYLKFNYFTYAYVIGDGYYIAGPFAGACFYQFAWRIDVPDNTEGWTTSYGGYDSVNNDIWWSTDNQDEKDLYNTVVSYIQTGNFKGKVGTIR